MSELKGQLLGILLVLMIFAAISGVLITAFTGASEQISTRITEQIEQNANSTFVVNELN